MACPIDGGAPMNRLLIVGAGGHGRSVAEMVLLAGQHELAGFVDDTFPGLTQVWGLPVLGTTAILADYRIHANSAIVALGNNRLREELHERLRAAGFRLITAIHPTAIVSPKAVIGPGSTIMAGAIVGTEARLGEGVIVNSGAVVDHHCQVEDFGHLGVNACMAGGAVLGRGAWMQAGAALGYGVKIASRTVLAPGEAIASN